MLLIAAVVLMGPPAAAMEAPGLQSPIGSPTEVPSAHRTGAIPSQPNLYGYAGNLTMTGNIGGGRHFRGFVPYGSMYYFDSGTLDPGRRAVDSFIRRSAGFEPYYDPSRTVSSMQRSGRSGLSRPQVSAQGQGTSAASRQWLDSFDVAELLRPPEQRPLAASAQSIEAILERQISRDLMKRPAEVPAEADPRVPGADISLLPALPELPSPSIPLKPEDMREVSERPAQERSFYQKMKHLLDPTGRDEASPGIEPEEEAAASEAGPGRRDLGRAEGLARPSDVIDPAMGRIALRGHPDYAHLARTKTEGYLAAGERFMKEGQYYRAADAFELASVWDRNNALTVLARCHALFAAGEYMSSAYFLGEALTMEPRLAEPGVDWEALLKTRDDYEDRLVELSTWQQRSNSAELAFLMGYVLFQDGKLTRGRISADYARDMMPDHKGAELLQQAIERALDSESPGANP